MPASGADARGQADERRVAPFDVAVERVADRARERRDPDRARATWPSRAARVKCAKSSSSGTVISPPPTPKSALKKPATTPMTARRSTARIVWAWTRSLDCVRRRSAPRSCSTSTARSRRSSRGRRTRLFPRRRARSSATSSRATRSSRAITGRPGALGRDIVGVEGVEVVGSHGLELADGADEWRARLQEFRRTVDWPVEDKGLALSYHYRTHDGSRRVRAPSSSEIAEQARDAGLRARFGRMVLELLPPLDAHKGTAVRALLQGPRPDAGALRGRRHDRSRRLRSRRGARGRREGRRRLRRGAARAASRAPIVVVAGPAGLVELLRTL